MPISRTVIEEAVARYERERDRYLKLAARVSDLCRVAIVEGNAVRAQVTFRTKTVKSFAGKLDRFSQNPNKKFDNVDQIFTGIGDFAGVRVATYQPEDVPKVAEMLCGLFEGEDGEPVDVDLKDRLTEGGFYRATHCQVFLREGDLVGNYENLRGTSCEIQICSMMAHVFNEIEHDIGYKPSGGGPNDVEFGLLESLGHLTRSGDAVITQLLAATEQRLEQGGGDFLDVHDLAAQLKQYFPSADLNVNAGQALESARQLGLTSVVSIEQQLGADALDEQTAFARIDAFNAYLSTAGEPTHMLNRKSADVVVVAMLHELSSQILDKHSASVSRARPPKIVSLAKWYKRFQEEGFDQLDEAAE